MPPFLLHKSLYETHTSFKQRKDVSYEKDHLFLFGKLSLLLSG